MEYENLIERLLADVPQIRPHYEEEIEWLEEDLPHVIFGMVVTPFIIKSIETQKEVSNLYSFLEEMAVADDKVQEVLVVSVLESLITDRDIIDTAKSHMGKLTKTLCETTETEYGY
ncbi:hypothetical protein A3842_21395 [Paenibacillus sp. P3E]|uniref:DUF7674 family protein n=1 Tax=Paenibacillus sp. P3E TaxID=1349435 RepID=UPI00093D1AF7|nr:hypothetical protein [Paenibacillus sp. P3E]OKP73898.1 hypothetical protein A3842_21395 [Paenibacillus sp. P3E]